MSDTNSQTASQRQAAETQDSLLDSLLSETKLGPTDGEAYELVRRGTRKLMDDLLRSTEVAPKIDKNLIDEMIADIDRRLSAQVNQILHHPQVSQLETSWRGLKYLVDQIDFRENVRLEIVNATKDDLRIDFEDAPDITKSGLYNAIYRNNFGTLGGKPYGVICSTYDFGTGTEDVQLLKQFASIGAMAHAPFLGNASPKMFGVQSFTELPKLKDLQALFEGPQYAKWNGLRETEDARYLGMCMPRFMLRAPYGKRESELSVKAFDFTEEVIDNHDAYLWGPASLAMAAKIADSFAKYRWCPNIIGPQGGGSVYNLPLHQYEQGGELKTKIPTEVSLDDRREYELAEQGFIGLVFRKDSDNAAFFSANSIQRPKVFAKTAEGLAAQTNYMLGTRLPYMFVITRLAHYMKVLQREQIGTWKSRSDLDRELNNWIRQYVSDMPDPPAATRSRKPLRKAKVIVEEVEGQVGWFRCNLAIEPHLKFEGAEFTLSLVGKLDKS
ncbi:type VI secretion system contractile sheath large subunit [Nannocystis radixulma]|uniref:Type VI secretion system contractile sheath large subunit n=1 Tax=Nannocystis radixulma TaxID=2995305 RepID=A0ABT5BQP7_9BACT|nr:type VI secretion system contractile sheath large subunit [Nannocystis radixulma]MDC0675884.1 type VI secretion system contractile sheath large subunit [Nannocystis radixulma]